MSVARWALALCLTTACAVSRPLAYEQRLAAGDRAFSSGRYAEAAAAYASAAETGGRVRDQDQARFLAAMAWRRAGDPTRALALFDALAASSATWDRGPRAAFEAAVMRWRSDDPATQSQGRAALEALIVRDPRTGAARRGVILLLRDLDAADPSLARSLAWLESLATRDNVRASVLYEFVRAAQATRLQTLGRIDEALAAWRRLLAEVPYPQNSHWDDGHERVALMLRARGDARGALAALDAMLAVREAVYSSGSYNAPRFDDGAMLRAEILRDDLHDLPAAAEAFHFVYASFRESIRRDDALHAEARVRAQMGDGSACAVWQRLAEEFPCRRFGRQAREEATRCGRTPEARAPDACRVSGRRARRLGPAATTPPQD